MNNYVQLSGPPEGEEDEGRHHKRSHHASIDIKQKIDMRLKFWLEEEGLAFLQNDLYCLTLADLRTISSEEIEQLSYNCNPSQKIRFKNAVNTLKNRGSIKTAKPQNKMKYDDIFKIILIGDCEVGKSSILNRFVKDEFMPEYTSTMGMKCQNQVIHLETAHKSVKLQIHDMSGNHEEFGTISKAFFRNTHGILFVYDITNKKSFNNIRKWIEKSEIYNNNSMNYESKEKNEQPKIWKMIIGNKCDLTNKRVVSIEERKQLADEYMLKSIECSAKKGNNVDELFNIAAQYLLHTWQPEVRESNCCCVLL